MLPRSAWLEVQPSLDPSRLVLIDETWAKTIRPLAELSWHLESHVGDCGDEQEAQAESAPTVSVAVGDDLEALEQSDDVLASDAGEGAVAFLAGCGQRSLLAAFFRHLRVSGPSLSALIAAAGGGLCFRMQTNLRLFEPPEAVAASFFVGKAEDASRRFFHDKLRFQRCRFFLPEEQRLCFLALSMGVPVASIKTMPKPARRPQRPCGEAKRNALLLARYFRTIDGAAGRAFGSSP